MDINLEKTKITIFRNGGPLKASENGILMENLLMLYHSTNIYVFISRLNLCGVEHINSKLCRARKLRPVFLNIRKALGILIHKIFSNFLILL